MTDGHQWCPWSDFLKAAGVDNGVGGWIFVPSFQSNGGVVGGYNYI
jgi:hypothetical protein